MNHPGQLPPPGFIRIHAKQNRWVSFVPPTISIDGQPVPYQSYPHGLPVIPGQHLVSGHGTWLWRYGRADLMVQVEQGQVVDVHYALPAITFAKGAIGFGPVKTPGVLALVLFVVAIVVIPIALVVLLTL